MSFHALALFPEEIASNLLELVGSSRLLAAELPALRAAVDTVRSMLADHLAVAAAIALWREQTAGYLAESEEQIGAALATLAFDWQGPAGQAHARHAAAAQASSGALGVAVAEVGRALAGLLEVSTAGYRSAVESLVTAASELVRLAGPGPVPARLTAPALEAIARFLATVAAEVRAARLVMSGYADIFRRVGAGLAAESGTGGGQG